MSLGLPEMFWHLFFCMYSDDELISGSTSLAAVERLRAIVQRLRSPGGCPWDAEQTHESLIGNLIEESYEVIDTIRRQDDPHLEEELGDLLLQVVFHAELGRERQKFDLDSVATVVADKLIRRHPHVFASAQAEDSEEVLRQWDKIKQQEKAVKNQGKEVVQNGYLDAVGEDLPAMLAAAKIQKKAAKVGFDWAQWQDVIAKIKEELVEVEQAVEEKQGEQALREELGDLLFATVNLLRHFGENPEECLWAANRKFTKRFRAMEQHLSKDEVSLQQADLAEMEAAWQRVKQERKES